MPVACGGTTRKLGLLPLLLLLAPSARVRSSPRTYSAAAAAAPAGGAAAGGGPGGQPGAGGGAAGGAAAARGRSRCPACSGSCASPSPAEAGAAGYARRPGAWDPRVYAPASSCTPPHPLDTPTRDRGADAGLGAAASLATALGALPRPAPPKPPRESGAWWAVNTEALTQFSPSGPRGGGGVGNQVPAGASSVYTFCTLESRQGLKQAGRVS